jgi:hypothetical protein
MEIFIQKTQDQGLGIRGTYFLSIPNYRGHVLRGFPELLLLNVLIIYNQAMCNIIIGIPDWHWTTI